MTEYGYLEEDALLRALNEPQELSSSIPCTLALGTRLLPGPRWLDTMCQMAMRAVDSDSIPQAALDAAEKVGP